MSNLQTELRKRLAAMASGKLEPSAFFAWFFPATWDTDEDRNPELAELVSDIELAHARWTAGELTRQEFIQTVRSAAGTLRHGSKTTEGSGRNLKDQESSAPSEAANWDSTAQTVQQTAA